MAAIEICEAETVYRYLAISRKEAVRILTEEAEVATVEELTAMTDHELCDVIQRHIEARGDVYDYLESEVVETDSGTEWTVETME